MIEIQTSRFGKISVDKEDIIYFPRGILGFEDYKRYVILNPYKDDESPFRWLQSLDDGDIAFVIIEPLNFLFEYDLTIPDADAKELEIKAAEDVVIYVIVTIPKDPSKMTANLQGPIIINAKNKKAKQIISQNPAHSIKTSIIEEMAKREAKLKQLSEKNKQKDESDLKKGGDR